MTPLTKRISLGLASALMLLFALYCALAIVQAGSIDEQERALFNLRFWGPLMALGLVAAIILGVLAARTGRSGARQ